MATAFLTGLTGTGAAANVAEEVISDGSWDAATAAWATSYGLKKAGSFIGARSLSGDERELEKFTSDAFIGSIPKLCRTIETYKVGKAIDVVKTAAARKMGESVRRAVPAARLTPVANNRSARAAKNNSAIPKPVPMSAFVRGEIPTLHENATINSRGRLHNRLGRFVTLISGTPKGKAAGTGAGAGKLARRTRRARRAHSRDGRSLGPK